MVMARRRRLLPALLAASLLAASVWYLAEHYRWGAAFDRLWQVDFVQLTLMVWLIHAGYIFVRTLRWHILTKRVNPRVRFADLYWISTVVVSLAIITPGQLGETLKIELLKRKGLLGRLPGLGSFMLERIMDLLVLVGMGLIGLMLGSGLTERHPGLGQAIVILALTGLATLYLLIHHKPGARIPEWLSQVRSGTGSPTTWIGILMLTLCSWFLIGAGWYTVLYAIGIELDLLEVQWLIALVTLGTVLSMIPGGLGVAEVLTVEALVTMGIDPATAQSGALILRTYALMVILFGLVHSLLWVLLWLRPSPRCHDTAN